MKLRGRSKRKYAAKKKAKKTGAQKRAKAAPKKKAPQPTSPVAVAPTTASSFSPEQTETLAAAKSILADKEKQELDSYKATISKHLSGDERELMWRMIYVNSNGWRQRYKGESGKRGIFEVQVMTEVNREIHNGRPIRTQLTVQNFMKQHTPKFRAYVRKFTLWKNAKDARGGGLEDQVPPPPAPRGWNIVKFAFLQVPLSGAHLKHSETPEDLVRYKAMGLKTEAPPATTVTSASAMSSATWYDEDYREADSGYGPTDSSYYDNFKPSDDESDDEILSAWSKKTSAAADVVPSFSRQYASSNAMALNNAPMDAMDLLRSKAATALKNQRRAKSRNRIDAKQAQIAKVQKVKELELMAMSAAVRRQKRKLIKSSRSTNIANHALHKRIYALGKPKARTNSNAAAGFAIAASMSKIGDAMATFPGTPGNPKIPSKKKSENSFKKRSMLSPPPVERQQPRPSSTATMNGTKRKLQELQQLSSDFGVSQTVQDELQRDLLRNLLASQVSRYQTSSSSSSSSSNISNLDENGYIEFKE